MVDTYDALLQFEDEYATKLLLSLLVFDNSEYIPNDAQSSHQYKVSLKRRINLAIGDMGQEKCAEDLASRTPPTNESETASIRANHHPAADHFLEELFRAPSLMVPASPARSPTLPTPSLPPTLGTIVGLDHLHNLVKLMEQLIQLKKDNTTLKRRCTYLEETRSLLLVQTQALAKKAHHHKKSRGKSQPCPRCFSPRLLLPHNTLPDTLHSGKAARSSFQQRSASVGSLDMVGLPDDETWASNFPNLIKNMDPRKMKGSKFSKWERVKKVFIKPGPVPHKSEVGAVSARQLLRGQSKHGVLQKTHTLSDIEGAQAPLFTQRTERRMDELGRDIRVTFEYYPSPFESQHQTLSASPEEKFLRVDHPVGSLTAESSSNSSGEESDMEGETLLPKRSSSLYAVTPPCTCPPDSKRKFSNLSQRHASSPDVKVAKSSMEEVYSPDKDQKKHHRTAWGRVKDIIQTRKNSLKRRGPVRNRVEDSFDKSSASLESSDSVFRRAVSPLLEADVTNGDHSTDITNRGVPSAVTPTRPRRNIKDIVSLSEPERGTVEKDGTQTAALKSETVCTDSKDQETTIKGTDIKGSEPGPHRRTSGANKAVLKRTAAVETRDNSQQTEILNDITNKPKASLCEKCIQTSPELSHKIIATSLGHNEQTVSESTSVVSVDSTMSSAKIESETIEGDICVTYTISPSSDDGQQATVIGKTDAESDTKEEIVEVSGTFICETDVSVEATCTIDRTESQTSKSSVSSLATEIQRPRLERQKERAKFFEDNQTDEEEQKELTSFHNYPPHSPVIRSKYPRRMRPEAKPPSTAGIQDWQGTPPRRQLRHRRVSTGSPKQVDSSQSEPASTDTTRESTKSTDLAGIPQSPGPTRQSLQPVSLAGPLKTAGELMLESESIRWRARAASCPADPRLKQKNKTKKETTESPQTSDEVINKEKAGISSSQSDVTTGRDLVKNASFLHDEFPLPEPTRAHTLPKRSSNAHEHQISASVNASLERKSSGESSGNNSRAQGTSSVKDKIFRRSRSPMPTVAALLKQTLTVDIAKKYSEESEESRSHEETTLEVHTTADGETTTRRKTIKTRLQEKAWFSKSKRMFSKTSK